jgi:hypothetical protein
VRLGARDVKRYVHLDIRTALDDGGAYLWAIITEKRPPPPGEHIWAPGDVGVEEVRAESIAECLRLLGESLDPQPAKPGDTVVTAIDHEARTITIGTKE